MDVDRSSMCASARGGDSNGRGIRRREYRNEREKRETRGDEAIVDVVRQGEKESEEENRGSEKEEAGKEGSRSTNMVDRPWMSGGAHGVTHAPHLAIRARASSLIK